jgi:hypothetical protein
LLPWWVSVTAILLLSKILLALGQKRACAYYRKTLRTMLIRYQHEGAKSEFVRSLQHDLELSNEELLRNASNRVLADLIS